MVVLDTNIIIDHLRQSPRQQKSVLDEIIQKTASADLAISIISLQEIFAGVSTRKKEIEVWILEVISALKVIPYTDEVAKLAGQLERDLGRPIEFPDAAIAATAILNKASLFTLNKKDFQGINLLILTTPSIDR